jgi:hypothetical protein
MVVELVGSHCGPPNSLRHHEIRSEAARASTLPEADLVEVVTQSNGSKLPREPLYFSKMVLPGIEEASAYLR